MNRDRPFATRWPVRGNELALATTQGLVAWRGWRSKFPTRDHGLRNSRTSRGISGWGVVQADGSCRDPESPHCRSVPGTLIPLGKGDSYTEPDPLRVASRQSGPSNRGRQRSTHHRRPEVEPIPIPGRGFFLWRQSLHLPTVQDSGWDCLPPIRPSIHPRLRQQFAAGSISLGVARSKRRQPSPRRLPR